jgi:hypothetical protein
MAQWTEQRGRLVCVFLVDPPCARVGGYCPGNALRAWIARHSPDGASPNAVLAFARILAEVASRQLSPV